MASSSTSAQTSPSMQATSRKDIDKERSKVLGKLISKQDDRLHNLQSLAFQLGNYYFVFQGIILTSVSSTSSLTCSDSWFLFTLSLLAIIVNIVAVASIGWKYINVYTQYRRTWDEYNEINARMNHSHVQDNLSHQFVLGKEHGNNNDNSKFWRYTILIFYMFFLLGFSGVTLYGSTGLLCEHDKQRSQSYYLNKSGYCFKLCNNSNHCMFLCADSAL